MADIPSSYKYSARVLGNLGLYYRDYETIPELIPAYGLNTYRKMRLNEPIIGGLLFHYETILKKTRFNLKGKVNKYVEETLTDRFFRKVVPDMASVLTYGFYCGEKIWKADDYVRLVDIEPRHQTTITTINKDNVVQSPETGDEVKIPKRKLVLFCLVSDSRYPYGISLLRWVYKPYFFKIAIEASEANAVDRDLAGLPTLTAPEGFNFAAADPNYPGYDPSIKDTVDWAVKVVTSIRKDNQQGVVLPAGWSLQLLRAEGSSSKSNTDEMIRRYNTEMCIGLLEAFMTGALGVAARGTQGDLYLQTLLSACNGVAQTFADVFNEQVIPYICAYNGAAVECWVEPEPATNYNLKDLASYVARLVAQGVIEPTKELENGLLRIADLPIDN